MVAHRKKSTEPYVFVSYKQKERDLDFPRGYEMPWNTAQEACKQLDTLKYEAIIIEKRYFTTIKLEDLIFQEEDLHPRR